MDRLKLIVAWEGYVVSAISMAVAVVMVVRDVAWPFGAVIGVSALCLCGMSHVALSRLRGARR